MRTAIVVVLIALIALYFLNPGMEDFRVFAGTQSERLLERELGDGVLGRALAGAGSALAARHIDRVTERRDYFFFSTYTIDLDGADDEGEEWRFLGVAGQFFETERPASLDAER